MIYDTRSTIYKSFLTSSGTSPDVQAILRALESYDPHASSASKTAPSSTPEASSSATPSSSEEKK